MPEILPDPEREVGLPTMAQIRRRKLPLRPRKLRQKVVKAKPPLADERLQLFENYLIARNRSKHTIEQYILHAGTFIKSADSAGFDPFTSQAVDLYIANLARAGKGATTRRWTYYLIRTFFRAHRKEWGFEPGEAPKKGKKVVHVFSEADLLLLERSAEAMGLEWHAMIRLENCTALRRDEIQRLNISNFQPPYLTSVQTAKGGDVVRHKLDPLTLDILQRYITKLTATRRRADMEALFINGKSGGRLSLSSLSDHFLQIRRNAGVEGKRAGFHATRRRRVTQLYDAGMKGAEITQIMGWKDPTTYLNYVHEVPKETEEKLERLHPYFSGGSADGFDKAKAVVEEAGEKPKTK